MRDDLVRLINAAIHEADERLRLNPTDHLPHTVRLLSAALSAQGETVPAPSQDHEWVLNEHPGSPTTWHYCRRCGVVQRADGGNKTRRIPGCVTT